MKTDLLVVERIIADNDLLVVDSLSFMPHSIEVLMC